MNDKKQETKKKNKLFLFRKNSNKDKEKTQKGNAVSVKGKKTKNKKAKTTREIKFSRSKLRRNVTFFVFLIVFASLFFNIVFFSKYQTIRDNVKAQQEDVRNELNKVGEDSLINSDAVIHFTRDFLSEYINVPLDEDDRENRQNNLKSYFVSGFDVTKLEDFSSFAGERKIKSIDYIDVDVLSPKEANVYFKIDYEVKQVNIVEETVVEEVVVEKKDKKGKKKKKKEEVEKVVETEEEETFNRSVYYVIPIVTDGTGFSVLENPSITEKSFLAKVDWEKEELDGDKVSATEREGIEDFLYGFFNSYGVSDERLVYMTNEDQGLNDQVIIDQSITNMIYNDENYYVEVDVSYQEKETNLINVYKYYLLISQQKNSYFVDEIKQGGF